MKRPQETQLRFDQRLDDTDLWMTCSGIFSMSYLREHVRKAPFTGEMLKNESTVFIRDVAQELRRNAPPYLRPPEQLLLLTTPDDALAILELGV